MASQWFCKVLGQEIGPVGFPDLVEMVRSGTLKEADPIRRDAATEWIRAEEVIGLFRATANEPAKALPAAAPAAAKPVSAPAKAEAAKPTTARPGRIGKRRATEFPPTDLDQVELAAQAGGAPTGIDMVWTDLEIQADALVGIAAE